MVAVAGVGTSLKKHFGFEGSRVSGLKRPKRYCHGIGAAALHWDARIATSRVEQ